ncbi:MAG: FYDLN acid domain-containing protein [Pelagibacteraceae bacterium]|nr:FYDLN acid domain-containing protein [Pelagibacteraceae bacterium]|tara:strand:- start:180 stop:464 length:285 start_codon:yes stop_codon:yes gene_type:complete
MADKKFGKKRVCENCEVKFYDFNKESPITCPQCKSQIVLEENLSYSQPSPVTQQKPKPELKDDLAEIESNDDTDSEEDIISLDDAELEEEETKN